MSCSELVTYVNLLNSPFSDPLGNSMDALCFSSEIDVEAAMSLLALCTLIEHTGIDCSRYTSQVSRFLTFDKLKADLLDLPVIWDSRWNLATTFQDTSSFPYVLDQENDLKISNNGQIVSVGGFLTTSRGASWRYYGTLMTFSSNAPYIFVLSNTTLYRILISGDQEEEEEEMADLSQYSDFISLCARSDGSEVLLLTMNGLVLHVIHGTSAVSRLRLPNTQPMFTRIQASKDFKVIVISGSITQLSTNSGSDWSTLSIVGDSMSIQITENGLHLFFVTNYTLHKMAVYLSMGTAVLTGLQFVENTDNPSNQCKNFSVSGDGQVLLMLMMNNTVRSFNSSKRVDSGGLMYSETLDIAGCVAVGVSSNGHHVFSIAHNRFLEALVQPNPPVLKLLNTGEVNVTDPNTEEVLWSNGFSDNSYNVVDDSNESVVLVILPRQSDTSDHFWVSKNGKYLLKYDGYNKAFTEFINLYNSFQFYLTCESASSRQTCRDLYLKYCSTVNIVDDRCYCVDNERTAAELFKLELLPETVKANLIGVAPCLSQKCRDIAIRDEFSYAPKVGLEDCPNELVLCTSVVNNEGSLKGDVASIQNCGAGVNINCGNNQKSCPVGTECVNGLCKLTTSSSTGNSTGGLPASVVIWLGVGGVLLGLLIVSLSVVLVITHKRE